MKLTDYMGRDNVLPDLAAGTKKQVLAELVAPVAARVGGLDQEMALSVLMEREKLGTTGIGEGIAIPHGKLPDIETIHLVVGRSREGVDFEALDFKPCHIFFLVLAPEQVAGLHLRLLAHISRLLKDDSFRSSFLQAADQDALWGLVSGA